MAGADVEARAAARAAFTAALADPTTNAAVAASPQVLNQALDYGRWLVREPSKAELVWRAATRFVTWWRRGFDDAGKTLLVRELQRDWAVARAEYEFDVAGGLCNGGLAPTALGRLRAYFATHPERHVSPKRRSVFAPAAILAAQLSASRGDDADSAIDLARRAQECARGLNWIGEADAYGVEALVLIELGLLDEAHPPLTRQREIVLRLSATQPDDNAKVSLCINEMSLYMAQRRHAKAVEVVERLRREPALAERLDLRILHRMALLGMAESESRRNRDAETELAQAIALPEAGAAYRVAGELALLRAAVTFDVPDAQRMGEALRASCTDVRHATEVEALMTYALRCAHARVPQGHGKLRAQLQRHHAALDKMLETWERTPARRGGVGFLALLDRRQLVTELVHLTRLCDGDRAAAETAVNALVRLQHMSTLARTSHAPRVSWADIRDVFVRPGQGVLFLLGEPRASLAVAIDANGPVLHELPSSRTLDASALALAQALDRLSHEQVGAAAANAAVVAARQLSADVLPQALRAVLGSWKGVTIADYGTLRGVPFECLLLGDALVGERMAVNTLTSLPFGVFCSRNRYTCTPVADARVRFVVTLLRGKGEAAGSDAPPGRRIEDHEWEGLRRGYGRPELLANEKASWAAAAPLLADATVSHFLAHGTEVEGDVAQGLALAGADDSSVLTSRAVEGQRVRGLVILSACESGRARRRLGDDSVHVTLGGAFLRAGAHTVVQSAADLHLAVHVDLMVAMHAGLQQGCSPAEALRHARDQGAAPLGWAERFEHAQVQVVGLGHLPVLR
jgi:hypothetical protein